ncbi:MAG: carboxypeptidase-like regulatory domain-containing protein [Verrucomicrobiota bacterium]
MKTNLPFKLALLLAFIAWPLASQAAVALSVSPAATSNTYSGVITLNITGLTNFQQIKLQTFLDLNGNGTIDSGEPMIDLFSLKESGATTVGGITNLNVPYDSNPATDAITATLSFALPLENMVGQKIYRVQGTTASAVLNITNADLGQSVSGVIYSNGVTPMAYAIVAALTATNQYYVGSAVADASGRYCLALPPGTYVLLPAFPGFYADTSVSPFVSLTNGMAAVNNLYLTNAEATIGGTVFDHSNSNAIGGIFMQGESGNLFEISFTDTNGYYSMSVTTDASWKIRPSSERLARRAYLSLQSNPVLTNAAAGNVTNANLGLYRGTNLFYGQLTISNQPVPNVAIEANDDGQIYASKGFTDSNGNYTVVTLLNTNALPPGAAWFCTPSPNGQWNQFTGFIFNYAYNVTFTNQLTRQQNFVGLPTSCTVSGSLVNNSNQPLSGVSVGGTGIIGGLNYVTGFADTDTGGNFTVYTAPGTWNFSASCCGDNGLENLNYFEAGTVPVAVPPSRAGLKLVAYPADQPQIGQPQKNDGSQFNFNIYGANGHAYQVQSLGSLAATNWNSLVTISNLGGNSMFIQDGQATNSSGFYRVIPVH